MAETTATTTATTTAPPAAAPDPEAIRREAQAAGWRDGHAKGAEATRAALLAELGLDTPEARKAYDDARKAQQAQEPEFKRAAASWQKAESEYKAKLAEREANLERLAQAYMETRFRAAASELARSIDAHDYALEDIYSTIKNHVEAHGEGEEKDLLFKDGEFSVDIDSAGAWKKIGEHIAKIRPHYVRSRLVGGGGTAGAAGVVAVGTERPKDAKALALHVVRKMYGGAA